MAVTKLGDVIDGVHADVAADSKVTKIKVSNARYNDLKTEYNKITGSTGELSSLLGIPVEVSDAVADADVDYDKDYKSDKTTTLTNVFA